LFQQLLMTSTATNGLLDRLEETKQDFTNAGRVGLERTLARLSRTKLNDPGSLIRYHEALLFLRAYPRNAKVLKLIEAELASFAGRVHRLSELDVDLAVLEHPEISGIAGTAVSDAFSYRIVRWLVREQPGGVALDDDWVDDESRLAATLPRFLPLLKEDALVEANVPYRKWLRSAKPARIGELHWLITRFESLPTSDDEKAEIYEALQLYARWRPTYRASRTGMRLPLRAIFYHPQPLIRRQDVSLAAEFSQPPLPVIRLSTTWGEKILNLARETSTVRYRELYGFTHGDPKRVLKIVLGRGVELYVVGLPPEQRLPLRSYHAAMIFKNGIPVAYFEGLSLFERMESGFNLYYTFRDGETAWLYAQTLRVFKQLLGVKVFTLDPYQIGFENEEGISSGAFWFYRKLGFRPTQKELVRLTLEEEKKLNGKPDYRTPASTLRKLAAGYMIYESDVRRSGEWDDFQVRTIGLAVERNMRQRYAGDVQKIRTAAVADVIEALDLEFSDWKPAETRALEELALPLALIPGLRKWKHAEKELLARVIRAKAGADESAYLRAMQRHQRLRAEFIKLGSRR
jgi:hypothetical protein